MKNVHSAQLFKTRDISNPNDSEESKNAENTRLFLKVVKVGERNLCIVVA